MSNIKSKNNANYRWIVSIIILAFIISILFTFISETAIPNINIVLGIILTVVFIFIGVLFDMIGVATSIADEAQFHSMASKKIKSAKVAIKLKKNAEKVSSFCNDVVGDICGIISGSTGAVISVKLSVLTSVNPLLITLIVMGLISALTIGGKALEKGFAMKKSNKILFNVSRILSIFIKE